jgi:thioredoxin reductase
MAELSRPFPPGDYPVVVIGSGPGGIQVSSSLRALGVQVATISADPGPGGMFRRWPFFQRLLSWTKPYAPVPRGSRAYERFDWNSLLSDDPAATAIQAEFMDGSSYFPSRPEMEANLTAFVERTGLPIRYDCTWTGTRREDGPSGQRFVVETTDGEYRCEVLVVAVGVAEPFTPPGVGREHAYHYADVRPAESYAGRRVFIIGKQNSGFELASGLLPWACQLVLASPSATKLSVDTRSLTGVRARYVQPFEDHVLGGGVAILDGSIDRIEATSGGTFMVTVRRSDGGSDLAIEVDDVISATGFVCPLVDLPDLGVTTFGASRVPAQTPWWESQTVPGIFFAGTIGQGAKGLGKHGMPSNSGAVHGARYNARVLAAHLATSRFGIALPRRPVRPDDLVSFIASELTEAPELWHQKGYLARTVTVDAGLGLVDDGVQPLTHLLDEHAEGVSFTLEADGTGAIYPVLYVRLGGRRTEVTLDPDPLLRYDTPAAQAAIAAAVAPLLGGAGRR